MGCTAKLTTRQRRFVQTDAVSQFTKQLHSAVQLPSPYPVLLGAFRRGDSQTQAVATLGMFSFFLTAVVALWLSAGFRPAGEVLFLRGQEKYPKEGRPC
jgi:hypothetical protein